VSLCRLAPALLGGSEPLRDASEMSAAGFVVLAATIVSVFTLTLAAYTYGGAPLGVAAALTTGLAVLTWTTTMFRRPRTAPEVWTALFPMVPAAYGIWRMISGHPGAITSSSPSSPRTPSSRPS
jgi:hypothetical protein